MGQIMTTPHNPPSAEAVAALDDYTEALQTFRSVGTASACAEADRLRARVIALLPKAEPQPSAEREAAIAAWREKAMQCLAHDWRIDHDPDAFIVMRDELDAAEALMRSQPAAPQAPAAAGVTGDDADLLKVDRIREVAEASDSETWAADTPCQWFHRAVCRALLAKSAPQAPAAGEGKLRRSPPPGPTHGDCAGGYECDHCGRTICRRCCRGVHQSVCTPCFDARTSQLAAPAGQEPQG